MSTIEPVLKLACCNVPTVYSNKQSYYECLCYLGYKINECINALNDYGEEWKSYVDNAIAETRAYVNEKFTKAENDAKSDNDKLEEKLTSLIDEVESSLTSIINDLREQEEADISNIYESMVSLERRLKDYIKEYAVNNIMVYDPTTGKYSSVNIVMQNIYQALRYYGIRADDFDSLQLTCDNFEDIGLTAYEFDLYSDLKLGKNRLFYMSNPMTGEWSFYQDVINQLYDYHRSDPFTASEFDGASNAICSALDALNWNATRIDTEGHLWVITA